MLIQILHFHKIKFKANYLLLLAFLISFFFASSIVNAQEKQYTIVIDAGHGGKDPGNLGNGFKEKDIVLSVSQLVGKNLIQEKDINVVYTRNKDVFIDLWKRGAIANEAKADLFVSIHCDSHTSNAFGAGTFVLGLRGNRKNLEIAKRENASILMEDNYQDRYKGFDPNSAESMIGLSLLQEENLDKSLAIASLIQNNFSLKLKRNDRKVKQDNFQVLRETIMPSVLVELGFLTNKNEGKYLNSTKGQNQMADQIANAIKNYISNIKINTVVDNVVEGKLPKGIEFKVQIASGKNKLETKSYNFKGLQGVERIQVGSFYKYYYGNTSDFKQAKIAEGEANRKGYKTAFIVAFKDGKNITVSEALKLQ